MSRPDYPQASLAMDSEYLHQDLPSLEMIAQQKGVIITNSAAYLLQQLQQDSASPSVGVVELTLGDLTDGRPLSIDEILHMAQDKGLTVCPDPGRNALMNAIQAADKHEDNYTWTNIAMNPIYTPDRSPLILAVIRSKGIVTLSAAFAYSGTKFPSGSKIVFGIHP